MNPQEWYDFLKNKYFFWKYTAPNRYKTTTLHLAKYVHGPDNLDTLHAIKDQLLSFDLSEIVSGLKISCKIRGLGVAGASGLLSILYPHHFATVDQFVVKALEKIEGTHEEKEIGKMKPENLTLQDGKILIQIMRKKAEDLNECFYCATSWTPRKIDMLLWAVDR